MAFECGIDYMGLKSVAGSPQFDRTMVTIKARDFVELHDAANACAKLRRERDVAVEAAARYRMQRNKVLNDYVEARAVRDVFARMASTCGEPLTDAERADLAELRCIVRYFRSKAMPCLSAADALERIGAALEKRAKGVTK